MSVNSGLKATKVIGQRKAFYRQRILEFSCARKETAELSFLEFIFNRFVLISSCCVISQGTDVLSP